MARQRVNVQLEQSDMSLALTMAKIANRGFSCTAIGEMQNLITKTRTNVRNKKKQGVQFPGHKQVKAAIERHLAMLCHNHTPGCLLWQNGTRYNPQTHCRCKKPGAPPPNRRRQQTQEPTPEPTSSLPKTPSATTSDTSGARHLDLINSLAGYAYLLICHSCAKSVTLEISGQDSEHDTDYDPDMLPDEGSSTG
jgi:hypothetical protein